MAFISAILTIWALIPAQAADGYRSLPLSHFTPKSACRQSLTPTAPEAPDTVTDDYYGSRNSGTNQNNTEYPQRDSGSSYGYDGSDGAGGAFSNAF